MNVHVWQNFDNLNLVNFQTFHLLNPKALTCYFFHIT